MLSLFLLLNAGVVRGDFTFGGGPSDYEEISPKADGTTVDWTEVAACSGGDEFNCFDSDTTDTTTYVSWAAGANTVQTFKTVATCPDDWEYIRDPDSVTLFVVAAIRGSAASDRDLKIGRSDASGFCGATSTVAVTADGKWDTVSITYARDTCDAAAWSTWNLNEGEWRFENTEVCGKGESYRVCHAWIEAYFFSSDSTAEDDFYVLRPDTILELSTSWETRDGCTSRDTCLYSMDCGRIVCGASARVLGFGFETLTLPPLVGIDSVEMRLDGWGTVANKDSLRVYYREATPAYYGRDTIGLGVDDSTTYVEISKVWVNNPNTDASWVAADINTPGNGFSFQTHFADTIWVRSVRLIVWVSIDLTKDDGTFYTQGNEDDGHTKVSGGGADTVTQRYTDLVFVGPSSGLSYYPWTFFRFENLTIPQASTIDSALMAVYCTQTYQKRWIKSNTFFEDGDSATSLADSLPDEIPTRSRTTDSLIHIFYQQDFKWHFYTVCSSGVGGLNTVVNRAGWASGNSAAVIFNATGVGNQQHGYNSHDINYNRPYLTVWWTEAAATGQVIIIGAIQNEETYHNPRRGVCPRAWE
jgi:hypothetical protein